MCSAKSRLNQPSPCFSHKHCMRQTIFTENSSQLVFSQLQNTKFSKCLNTCYKQREPTKYTQHIALACQSILSTSIRYFFCQALGVSPLPKSFSKCHPTIARSSRTLLTDHAPPASDPNRPSYGIVPIVIHMICCIDFDEPLCWH